MIVIIIIKDINLNEIGILDNVYNIQVERAVNEVWQSSFSMPIDDPKNKLCSHFNFVEIISKSGRNYGMYRLMPTETKKSDNSITYKCEHVFATLMDDVIDGYLPAMINQTTRVNLQRLLDLQTTKHWVLGAVEFERYFQYSFENENGILAPILSIPQPFNEPYEFSFDTTVYPWKLNLIRSSDEVKAEIRWGKDMVDFEKVSDPSEIVNYIIPKGAGEGVNQLTIEDVNNGKRYLKDDESIAKWGKKTYIWIDQRFTNSETLKANAESLLEQWKDPKISFKCSSVDLSILPEHQSERKVLNGITRIIVEDKEYSGRILKEKVTLDKEHEVEYEIANKLDDIATTQADLERKQQVNEAYSQGATNIYADSLDLNCDPSNPALFKFYIYEDYININKLDLTFETTYFEGYIKAMESAGQVVQTATTEGGGGVIKSETTGNGGQVVHSQSYTSSFTAPNFFLYSSSPVGVGTGQIPPFEEHFHAVEVVNELNHRHSVPISITIPGHSHPFTIDLEPHVHDLKINMPGHVHPITYGIFKYSILPTSIQIKIDGNVVDYNALKGENLDLTPYLQKDSEGKITRNRWASIEITPNNLAKIRANLYVQVFIQSRGTKTL
ncbi:phage tail spike protein [Ornithinibacillus xuwenensis]|uniref:Phage tail spike protein n=1 Tax=Ornithinibacillus xuwenensis TaxID=3144668 RepID=A0ABU9XDM8_9BACI